MSQIGITTYKDLVNAKHLGKLKEDVEGICINYKNLANDTSIENRESELFEQYTAQYQKDIQSIINIRNFCADLINRCDMINFIISKRSIEQHVYNWDDEI